MLSVSVSAGAGVFSVNNRKFNLESPNRNQILRDFRPLSSRINEGCSVPETETFSVNGLVKSEATLSVDLSPVNFWVSPSVEAGGMISVKAS